VWHDAKNAEIKAKRRKPNVLHQGDVVYIPRARKTGQPLSKGTTNTYQVKVPRKKLSLTFKDDRVQNAEYTVRGLGSPVTGSTSSGAFSVDVPVYVREIVISFDDIPLLYNVRIGDLDPIAETSGVRQRLEHLGFRRPIRTTAETEEEAAEADSEAITAFQVSQGLDATGTLDDATHAALESAHGS
jgi:peptidoglycan hydrolase-like protein with peptidoglycan-binding domain